MSPVTQYKTVERKVAQKAKQGANSLFHRLGHLGQRIWRFGRQNFTIMLIPHSEKKILNFKISVFALAFFGVVAIAMVAAFLWTWTGFTSVNRMLALKSDKLETAQANLDTMREEVAQLRQVSSQFEESLDTTLQVVGIDLKKDVPVNQTQGDLATFLNLQQSDHTSIHEVGELKTLRDYMQTTSAPLEQIGNAMAAQKSLLVDIPTLWPLQGVRGYITNPFGPSIHPFTGQWYLHKGIDIAQRLGTPVVATANGKVTKVGYEPTNYGNFVEIKHNYGFSTKYGHFSRVYVNKGDDVKRGQVIGAIGSTGLATGPHLHYEIRIGTEVVDPTKYLSISSVAGDKDE